MCLISRILLISVQGYKSYPISEEPGIGYISSYLISKGYDVKSCVFYKNNIDIEVILKYSPQIIGIPVYIDTIEYCYRLCNIIKSNFPNILICLGSYEATYNYKRIMKELPSADYIIRGEGEMPFYRLILTLNRASNLSLVNGLVYRENGKIIANSLSPTFIDMENSPPLDRSILLQYKLKEACMSTTRGCRRNCSFCSSKSFWKRWRGRSYLKVVDEIDDLYNNYNIRHFLFLDNSYEDSCDNNNNRILRIANELLKRNLKLVYNVNFRAEFFKNVDLNTFYTLTRSGLYGVFIGIEAGNEEDLRKYNKTATVGDNSFALSYCRDNNIYYEVGFININPYSTVEKLRQNANFIFQNNLGGDLKCILSRYKLIPQTTLYKKVKNDGLLIDNCGDVDYRAVDDRIAMLNESFDKHIKNLNPNLLYELQFWNRIFASNVAALKSYAQLIQDNTLMHATTNIQKELNDILQKINSYHKEWYDRLLLYAENRMFDECKIFSMKRITVTKYIAYFEKLNKLRSNISKLIAGKYDKYFSI